MTEQIVDDDSLWQELMKRFEKAPRRLYAQVGVQGSEAEENHPEVLERNESGKPTKTAPGKFTTGEIASIHEFGIGQKERSFLRSTMDRERKRYEELLEDAAGKIIDGANAETLVGKIGQAAASDVKDKTIPRSIGIADISQATKDAKRSSKPLIDQGLLRQSITSIVEQDG